ncbi:MAG: HAD-IA family hydrolase [Lachnospiraceae bacterium]|nr:HAD-IA family hydrolase [Lachnospiraceae bacterium]
MDKKNEHPIETIIFDLDGTLLDTLDDLYESVNAALKKAGYPTRSRGEVRRFLGNGIRRLMEQSVPAGISTERMDMVFEDFKAYYIEHCEDRTRPFDGILEVLRELKEKGLSMAIVSNKADLAVKELSEKYFDGIISVAIGEREGVKRKPEPDSVLEAMRILGAEKETTIYIGDSEVDRATAENAGVPCVLVAWGFRDEKFLSSLGADYLIHRPEEILKIVF